MQKELGNDSVQTAQAIANLGNNIHNQGKYADAEPFIREGLEAHRRLLGEGHSRTTWSYLKRISNWWAQGKYREIAGQDLPPQRALRRHGSAWRHRAGPCDTYERIDSDVELLVRVAAQDNQPALAWQYLESRLARGLLDDLVARSRSDRPTKDGSAIGAAADLAHIQERLQPDALSSHGWISQDNQDSEIPTVRTGPASCEGEATPFG